MKLKDKYNGEYFKHWLVMLSTINIEFNKKGFETQIENYINFEGEEELKMLQREVDLLVESKDLMKFKEIGKQFVVEEINEYSLQLMAEVISNWKG